MVQFGAPVSPGATAAPAATADESPDRADHPHGDNRLWAELMRRSLGLDVLACPRCGGRLRLIALIDDPAVTQRVLRHLGLRTDTPEARPARAPPVPVLGDAPPTAGAHDQFFAADPA